MLAESAAASRRVPTRVRYLLMLAVAIALVGARAPGASYANRGTGGLTSEGPSPTFADIEPTVPGQEDQSEFMIGSIAVGLVLVESRDGPLNWTDTEENQTVEGVRDALRWWGSQEPRAHLGFELFVRTQVLVSIEPTHRPISAAPGWISEALADLGFTRYPSDPILRARDFNEDLRRNYGTDWAFTIFVADSDDSRAGTFYDGEHAQSLYGGPWIVMSRFSSIAYNSQVYRSVVPAHEMGHVFYATDEYDSNPPQYSGYLGLPDANGEDSVMNRNTPTVGPATAGQLGWVDSDSDGLLDILDVDPIVRVTKMSRNEDGSAEILGYAQIVPLPNRNLLGARHDLTLARAASIQVRTNDGDWEAVTPADGTLGGYRENFEISLWFRPRGGQAVEIRAVTTYGNTRVNTTVAGELESSDAGPAGLVLTSAILVGVGISMSLLAWHRLRRRSRR